MVDTMDDSTPKPLPADQQERWDTLKEATGELGMALDQPETLKAAIKQIKQIGAGIDHNAVVNALHVPEDAGEHEEGLRNILLRIPDGWGRWIRVDKGWYPLICDLDHNLAELFPDYILYQVKQKFGGLRYYWEASVPRRSSADYERRLELANGIVGEAEQRSVTTCEFCGNSGEMSCTDKAHPWYLTLCDACRNRNGGNRYLTYAEYKRKYGDGED
jgi:hypothetical protein